MISPARLWHSLAARKDNRHNGNKQTKNPILGVDSGLNYQITLSQSRPLSENVSLSNVKGSRLFPLWHLSRVSADNHHGSRVWWGRRGGIGFPGVCGVSASDPGYFWKEAHGAQCTFLAIHKVIHLKSFIKANWSSGENEWTFQKGHYNTILGGWVSLNSRGESGAWMLTWPVPGGHPIGSEKSWGNSFQRPSFHLGLKIEKNGSAEQISWFLIHCVN